jgi:hypothetical protein
MVNMKSGIECPLLGEKCLEEGCEWWIMEENMCSVSSLARAINTQKKII